MGTYGSHILGGEFNAINHRHRHEHKALFVILVAVVSIPPGYAYAWCTESMTTVSTSSCVCPDERAWSAVGPLKYNGMVAGGPTQTEPIKIHRSVVRELPTNEYFHGTIPDKYPTTPPHRGPSAIALNPIYPINGSDPLTSPTLGFLPSQPKTVICVWSGTVRVLERADKPLLWSRR